MVDELSQEEKQMYMQQLQENYQSPSNFGKLDDYTFLKRVKNASCGDSFDFYVKLDENGLIVDLKFFGEGCAISTASFSLFTQKVKGMSLKDAKSLSQDDIYEMIGLPISPGRINCAMLSLRSIQELEEN